MHEREYLGWGPPVVVSNLLDPVYERLELHGVVKETFSGYRLQSSKEQAGPVLWFWGPRAI
jgi:hypothetical protein